MSKLHVAEKQTHLLFIDKDASSLHSLSALLHPKNFVPHFAEQFDAARECLSTYPIDLVIINVHLRKANEESGFEFASWLRESSPYSQVDILFTNHGYPARLYEETATLRYQALAYLDKPISLPQWEALFNAYLNQELHIPTAPQRPSTGIETNPLLDPEAFLQDPEEWAESVFSSSKEQGVFSSDTQDALAQLDVPSTPSEALNWPSTEGRQKTLSLQEKESKQPRQAKDEQHKLPTLSDPLQQWEENKTDQMPLPSASQTPTSVRPSLEQELLPIDAQEVFAKGLNALNNNQPHAAMLFFQQALQAEERPDFRSLYAWTLGVTANGNQKQLKTAERMLIQVTQEVPAYEQGHLLLGRFYRYYQRSRDAFEAYRIALSYNPQFQEVYREYRLLQLQMTR